MKKKSAIAFLLSLGISLTMTACSFSFSGSTVANPGTQSAIRVEIGDTLGETIEQTDLADEDQVETLAEEVRETAQDIAQDHGIYFEEATLIRVVDGDTIVVEIDNEQVKVRMIGIDTPESVASKEYLDRTGKENTEEGFTASDYTKALLTDVHTVYLQKDTSDTDRYGRLLRYVWLQIPDEITTDTIAEYMVNGILLTGEKVAKPATYEPDTQYAEELEDIYLNY